LGFELSGVKLSSFAGLGWNDLCLSGLLVLLREPVTFQYGSSSNGIPIGIVHSWSAIRSELAGSLLGILRLALSEAIREGSRGYERVAVVKGDAKLLTSVDSLGVHVT
jgi:hypothetical protein